MAARWTASEDATALELRRQGMSWPKIADHLGRSKSAVIARFVPDAFVATKFPKRKVYIDKERLSNQAAGIDDYDDTPLGWI